MPPTVKASLDTLSGAQLAEFRDALVSAFPTWNDLSEFAESSDLVKNLEAAVGRSATAEAARELLKQQQSAGQLDLVLDHALERRPRNKALAHFAKSVGRHNSRGTFEPLAVESFDLRKQETLWRDAFGADLTKRIIVFIMRDVEQEVMQPLVERLRRFIAEFSGTGAHYGNDVTLRPDLSNLEEAVGRVASVAPLLATRPVLIKVHGEKAQDHIVNTFLDQVRARFGIALDEHLVLLLNVTLTWPAVATYVELPPWAYEEPELNLWINNHARRMSWPKDLIVEFQKYVCRKSTYNGRVTPGGLYDTLAFAIEYLREEPSADDLRAWMRANA